MSDNDKNIGGKLISLHEMLTDKDDVIHKILIPKIQRDYAQGRDGEESIRSRFLESLFDVIDDNEDTELLLDFVFGQKEEHVNNIFYPVDGQQRLTTLFLLHLYIGKRAGMDVDFLRKFSYEPRESSKQFCQRLQDFSSADYRDIRKHIEDKWWFTGLWRTDPTIKAMLNMLSAIDAHYVEKGYECDDFKRIWERLKNRVRFWRLNLSDLNTTDELYIKMNSRGKKLTDFEHFKAMLDEYAQTGGRLSTKIDTRWTNLLWQYHDASFDLDLETDDYVDNKLDLCFHNLLLFYLNIEGCKRGYIDFQSPETDLMKLASCIFGFTKSSEDFSEEEIKRLKAKKIKEAQEIMSRFETIMDFFSEKNSNDEYVHDPENFFGEYIQCDYNTWCEEDTENSFLKSSQKVFLGKRGESDLLHEVCNNGLLKNNLTIYVEAFFQYAVTEITPLAFQNRLRILRNIVENTEIHTRDFKNTLLVVDELIANGNLFLTGVTDELNKTQKKQEIFKESWLAKHSGYDSIFKATENHWLLMGNLNTLIEYDPDDEPIDINITALERFGRLFNSSCDYMRIERALLTVGDYSPNPKVKGVKPYGGSDWGQWKDLTQSFNKITPTILQQFLCKFNNFSSNDLDVIIYDVKSITSFPWEYYLSKYEPIYLAPRAKYRFLGGKYSYLKLNANGGGGREFYWNPFNLAVSILMKKEGFNCRVDEYGGALFFDLTGICADIKEHSIEFCYPDGYKFMHQIPQDSLKEDIVNRIEYSIGACKRVNNTYHLKREEIGGPEDAG